jgi:hypothetical protein
MDKEEDRIVYKSKPSRGRNQHVLKWCWVVDPLTTDIVLDCGSKSQRLMMQSCRDPLILGVVRPVTTALTCYWDERKDSVHDLVNRKLTHI